MSISPGYTDEEIREFVNEYDLLPHGSKAAWLTKQDFSRGILRRWRRAVYDGDLERGLVPLDNREHLSSRKEQHAMAQKRLTDGRDQRIKDLEGEVRQLEEANEILGKAIGLLHDKNAQKPDGAPAAPRPSSSSKKKTHSSGN